MANKTGLGRGLDALFGDNYKASDDKGKEDNEKEVIEKIKIVEIEPNREQPRKNFDEESLEELANSIKEYGVIQPIIVTKKDDYYEIIAGERRWRAAKKAGLTEMPCIIREDKEQTNREIALIENIQRKNLNPIEKAMGLRKLLDDYGMSQQALADKLGMSRASVTNSVRILNLDKRVIDLVLAHNLTERHCRALLRIEDPDKQYEMAKRFIENNQKVEDAELAVNNVKQLPKKDKDKAKKYEAIYRDIENSFQGFFGTKVKLEAGKRKGKIVIEYASNDDLERILSLIK